MSEKRFPLPFSSRNVSETPSVLLAPVPKERFIGQALTLLFLITYVHTKKHASEKHFEASALSRCGHYTLSPVILLAQNYMKVARNAVLPARNQYNEYFPQIRTSLIVCFYHISMCLS